MRFKQIAKQNYYEWYNVTRAYISLKIDLLNAILAFLWRPPFEIYIELYIGEYTHNKLLSSIELKSLFSDYPQ